jgi:rhodanese-related sulfurtransferase
MKTAALSFALALLCIAAPYARAAENIDKAHLIQPEELVKVLQSKGEKPLVLMIGFRVLYAQAHIPGAEYIGPTSEERGITQLRQRAQMLPRKRSIVLYCGCCPWAHCPNVDPALKLLRDLGFTNVKVLYIANDFGRDWMNKGYPVEKGQ